MPRLTMEQRHHVMAAIHSKDTKPEVTVRRYLFSKGLRFRKNDKRFPGCPDIVLPKYKTVIFINGCFWHQHPGCKHGTIPSTNQEYWIPKLRRNVERDQRNYSLLKSMGWKVLVVWECELAKEVQRSRLEQLYEEITQS